MLARSRLGMLCAVWIIFMLTACQTSPQVIKVGFVAPFEGRYREIGLDVIPATRLAIREWADQHPDSDYVIELVAYDDGASPTQAIEQAHKLAADPNVAVVIGHWRDDTTIAALDVYTEAGIPLVAFTTIDLSSDGMTYNVAPASSSIEQVLQEWLDQTNSDTSIVLLPSQSSVQEAAQYIHNNPVASIGDSTWGLSQFYSLTESAADGSYFASGYAMPTDLTDAYWTSERILAFEEGFRAGSLGAPPGLFSVAAYEAAWVAINMIASTQGISPSSVNPATTIEFDREGRRINAPIYLYQWLDGARQLVERFD
jgi:ABC-type branched-subunit amino acid transport system substrate-binding protein